MRYKIRHQTIYAYAEQVDLAAHMLHLSPRPLDFQRVMRAQVTAEPQPSRTSWGLDHFGNQVCWMFLDAPHARFAVTVDAEVEIGFPTPPIPELTLPWELVAAEAMQAAAAEFAFASPIVPDGTGAGAYAAPSFLPGRPILVALLDLTARINRDFAFKPGATTVNTSVADVLHLRAGVCQDFTHLMLAALRAHGVPARYVSGYLRTRPMAGQPARRGADQSHAWVSAWLGQAMGWVDLDPTNNLVVQDEHVVLAWGRDYGDISPVRGVILGGGAHSVTVGVDLEAI